VQIVALQCLRAFVTAGITKPQSLLHSTALKYISTLGADIVLGLQRMSKLRDLSAEQVTVCSESVRILVLVQASSPAEKRN
jgi:hypothetical protein